MKKLIRKGYVVTIDRVGGFYNAWIEHKSFEAKVIKTKTFKAMENKIAKFAKSI